MRAPSGRLSLILAVALTIIAAPVRAADKSANARIVPRDGVILGPGAAADATQVEADSGVKAELSARALRIELPAEQGEQTISLKPALGRWDLRRATDIYLKVRNQGRTPVTLSAQATSNSGPTDLIPAAKELAPGATREIVVPFAAVVPWKGGDSNGTGTKFSSDAVSAVKISVAHAAAASLLVESVTAKVTIADLPGWLGKRPPVAASEAGDWVNTFDEEFRGRAIDQTKWNIYGPNYWDSQSHWSKDNLILGGGVLRMRFERKTGFHNDDPKGKQTAYACGYLDTYGKWVQRYGYFECRLKLPDAPGLWPTFWLMPDRGPVDGPQWKRSDTGNGGMEFDIMEHLTRWGPYRYNICQHWDGYGAGHKVLGTPYTYVQPDREGFLTVGFLWTPGHIAYYCNGKEVGSWDSPRVSTVPSHLIFETTTGGWDNDKVDNQQLPVDYLVSYVRIWQRKDLASSADGYMRKP